jgi:anti-anti-sigma factor
VTAIAPTETCLPVALPHTGFPSRQRVGHSARFNGRLLRSSVAVISADGDIDASNTDVLIEYTLEHMIGYRGLVLDLRGLDFFGAEGFSALLRISVNCARVGTGWAIVPGAVASRTLRICDPQDSLPLADTVETALTTLTDQLRRPSRLIAAGTNGDG